MAKSIESSAKAAHVNLMPDTVIANLPEETLRSVLRSILTSDPSISPVFEHHARIELLKATTTKSGKFFSTEDGAAPTPTDLFFDAQRRVRSMLGCGLCYESTVVVSEIVDEINKLANQDQTPLKLALASLDGDVVQAMTAVQKTLLVQSGIRLFSLEEKRLLSTLYDCMHSCQKEWESQSRRFPLERGLHSLESLLGIESRRYQTIELPKLPNRPLLTHNGTIETFTINGVKVPRIFSGLWQLSSPSWGVASQDDVFAQFAAYTDHGLRAFDMADHYGDAEIIFGQFRNAHTHPGGIFGATKYCVFGSIDVSQEVITANITERCHRMNSKDIDLLQCHWQNYDDHQYIQALQLLQQDARVRSLGLCNFDTKRMEEIVLGGITIASNQVQFSLIDNRPIFQMGPACLKHNINLLTYGTLCGGFLSDRYLNAPEPTPYSTGITPSQRKYLSMILAWGSWALFQELLQVLAIIAGKHSENRTAGGNTAQRLSISTIATRWVLDFPYVGAVIVGARMGITSHAEENMAVFGWGLDPEDRVMIEEVLKKGRGKQMFEEMGDCGAEYRETKTKENDVFVSV